MVQIVPYHVKETKKSLWLLYSSLMTKWALNAPKVAKLVWSFAFITSVLPVFSSARVTISFPDSFPNLFSLPPFACRIGDGEEWTVKGDDPCLPPLSSFPPLSLAFSSLSQHYKAPCPLWLLTLTWARKRLRSGLACVRYREGERLSLCVRVGVWEHICVCSAQTQVNNQTEEWLLGCCITTNSFLVQQSRDKRVFSACLLWEMALTWKDEKTDMKEKKAVCVLYVCLVTRDKWSRGGGGIDRKIEHGQMRTRPAGTCFLLSRF